jgi:integrase
VQLSGKRVERLFASEDEARRWLADTVRDWKDSGVMAPATGAPSLGTYLAAWLGRQATGAKRGSSGQGRTGKTLQEYRKKVETYIVPTIGTVRLDAVTADHVEGMKHAMRQGYVPGTKVVLGRGKALSPRTINSTRGILQAALDDALRRGELSRNPARAVAPDKNPAVFQGTALTVEQWRAVLNLASANLPESVLVSLTGTLGARRGEICGLKWESVHLDDPHPWIEIGPSLQQVTGQGLTITPGKNKWSVRAISIPQVLAEHLQRVDPKVGFVVSGLRARDPSHSTLLAWEPIREAAGLTGVRLHDLRHTIATLAALSNRISEAVLKLYLGHAPTGITQVVYTNPSPAQVREATRAVADLVDELYAASFKI